MPAAKERWLPEIATEWDEYRVSKSARLLEPEDVRRAVQLFDLKDRAARMWEGINTDAADSHKALQALRILEGLIDRREMSLGIGPLGRARLGVTTEATETDALEDFLAETDG